MLRSILVIACLLTLAACATPVPNPIDAQTRGDMFVKGASVTWSLDDQKRLSNDAYVKGKAEMIDKLKAAVENEFKNSPAGSQPVTFKIDVTQYGLVGNATQNFFAGSDTVTADVTVVRASDGKELGVYRGVVGFFNSSGGGLLGAVMTAVAVPDPTSAMAHSFAATLRAYFAAP